MTDPQTAPLTLDEMLEPADDAVARHSKIGRTAVQVGIPTAIVTIFAWSMRLAGVDLDPGPGVEMPTAVAASFIALVTAGLAWAMNRKPK